MRTRPLIVLVVSALVASCLPDMDEPTLVHDLRVLGVQLEPPELLAGSCASLLGGNTRTLPDGGTIDAGVDFTAFISFATPIEYTALIQDPGGNGRELSYRLLACASTGDRTCSNENEFLELKTGTTTAGEFRTKLDLIAKITGGFPNIMFQVVTLPDGKTLLEKTIDKDTFKGLGGIRVPLVLDLSAPDGQHVYVQKLMVYGCKFFPDTKQNVTPVLPGVTLNGDSWDAGTTIEAKGKGPFWIEPLDFSALQEPYVVPSLTLMPVSLTESWKISWYTTEGRMSPDETGGVSVAGMTGELRSKWTPAEDAGVSPRDVRFWAVVRDGRGGQSWLERTLRYAP